MKIYVTLLQSDKDINIYQFVYIFYIEGRVRSEISLPFLIDDYHSVYEEYRQRAIATVEGK